jgi:hypothetical protein
MTGLAILILYVNIMILYFMHLYVQRQIRSINKMFLSVTESLSSLANIVSIIRKMENDHFEVSQALDKKIDIVSETNKQSIKSDNNETFKEK